LLFQFTARELLRFGPDLDLITESAAHIAVAEPPDADTVCDISEASQSLSIVRCDLQNKGSQYSRARAMRDIAAQ
jgi:hypothetical protein